jgi:hypothetical protein
MKCLLIIHYNESYFIINNVIVIFNIVKKQLLGTYNLGNSLLDIKNIMMQMWHLFGYN